MLAPFCFCCLAVFGRPSSCRITVLVQGSCSCKTTTLRCSKLVAGTQCIWSGYRYPKHRCENRHRVLWRPLQGEIVSPHVDISPQQIQMLAKHLKHDIICILSSSMSIECLLHIGTLFGTGSIAVLVYADRLISSQAIYGLRGSAMVILRLHFSKT